MGIFDQFYQKVLNTNNQIRRSHYQQLWQKLSRQMKNTQQQIINLAQVLNRESQVADIQKLSDNIAYEQRRITDIVNGIKIEIQNAKDDRDDAQDKSINLEKVAAIAAALLTGVGLAAQGIAQLPSSLQSIGLLR